MPVGKSPLTFTKFVYMLKRVLTIAIIMTGSVLLANAQTKDDFTPKKGDKSVSLNLGVGSFVGMEAPAPDLSTYNITAPQTSWFDKQLSLNFEFRWMFAKKWALKAMGGFSFKHNPEYQALPGNSTDGKFETGDIPDYNFVTSKDKIKYSIVLGAERFVKTKYDKLFFRYGGEFGFSYGKQEAKADDESYLGKSIGEAFGYRVAGVTGFDYFVSKAFFISIEIRPIAYDYTVYNIRPQVGLKLLSSDTHGFDFLSNPMLKIGFRF